jgi:tRNA threonylcarbamoyladenosine biosynthesis protein TsaB
VRARASLGFPRPPRRSAVETRTFLTYHLPGMLVLGVDTSEPLGGVALFDGHGLADERWMEQPLQHAERLFPLIEEILSGNGADKGQLGLVCVHRGPGSFTGLRIGLAAAKGFCQAAGVPLVGVDGANAYRARVGDAKRICVIVASRRDLSYAQFFVGSRPRGPMALVREAALLESLRGEEREVTLVGSGASRIGDALSGHTMIRIAPEEANRSSSLWIAKLGSDEKLTDRLYEVEPLYVEPLLA